MSQLIKEGQITSSVSDAAKSQVGHYQFSKIATWESPLRYKGLYETGICLVFFNRSKIYSLTLPWTGGCRVNNNGSISTIIYKRIICLGRVTLEIVTFGLAALARTDNLTTNHEAFVALGCDPSGRKEDVLFVAEFGEGNIIPRFTRREFLRMPPQEMSGTIAKSTR